MVLPTQQEAKDMRDAIRQLQVFEARQQKIIQDGKMQIAIDWWDTKKPSVPTTRNEALTVFRFIETILETEQKLLDNETVPVQKEIHQYRIQLLGRKLQLANEKFKEIKRNE